MASSATNTTTRALILGEDKARKAKMIVWLQNRQTIDQTTINYLRSGRR